MDAFRPLRQQLGPERAPGLEVVDADEIVFLPAVSDVGVAIDQHDRDSRRGEERENLPHHPLGRPQEGERLEDDVGHALRCLTNRRAYLITPCAWSAVLVYYAPFVH